jgi:hypothetical protein
MFIFLEKILAGDTAEPLSATSLKVSLALVQVKRTNSHAIEIAPKDVNGNLPTTGKAHELIKPVADEQLVDYEISPTGDQNVEDLSEWYILGTAGEGVNIVYEVF